MHVAIRMIQFTSFRTNKQMVEPTGKRPLGWPRRRLEDNIKHGFEEISVNMRNWIVSAQYGDY